MLSEVDDAERAADRRQILVIEDDEVVRASMVRFLQDCEYEVLEAIGGRAGIEAVQRSAPDLVLLDLWMPEVDGFGVLSALREEFTDTPVIIVSGTGQIEDAIKALRLGAWDFLLKPIENMALVEHAVDKALERGRLIQENRRYHEHLEQDIVRRTADLITTNEELSREIVERKRAEAARQALAAQVQQAQKLESLGVMAGGIAHDFNNLLVGILGNAGLALLDMQASPARRCVEDIEASAKHAAALVHQMLAYSGKGQFVVKPIDLRTLVEEMAHLLEVAISKKVTLRYDFAAKAPAVEADETQVRQIVMNLITNAAEAIGDDHGEISVSTGMTLGDREYLDRAYLDDDLPQGVYCHIEVSDTGCGMDPETVERIFDPFFTSKFAGRGLGLAAVLGIVRGHRGAITVDSAPGQGTVFKVLFPASDRPAEVADDPAEPIQWSGEGTVLLVDDDRMVRLVGQRTLERAGFDIITARNGQEAIDKFSEDPDRIGCVLLDLTMPKLDGEECLHALRKIRADVRVILSSGYDEQALVSRVQSSGLMGFLQKPYQPRELIVQVQRALADC